MAIHNPITGVSGALFGNLTALEATDCSDEIKGLIAFNSK